jgi:crotonobetainyl-CoA:carnitine CoA-transferase CaiB-like acyl-CoA transferase
MAGPLDGIKVIEISHFHQGPVAGMLLGDLGADVIKVEPHAGDHAREFMKILGVQLGLKGRNFYFEACNRNKRGIVLDLKKKQGLEVFLKLIDRADVFLNNLSIDAPYRIGINYEALSRRNPRLIYAHASGWGRRGPDAETLSFDYTGLARSGTMMMCGEAGDPPKPPVPGFGDQMGAIMCAFAVCAALCARDRTGKGQLVDTSLLGSMICLETTALSAPCIIGQEYPRLARVKAGNPLYNHYQCRDGKWVALGHMQPDRYWSALCKAMDMTELEHDPRFATFDVRGKNAPEMISILDAKFATKNRDKWLEVFRKEGIIHTLVQSATEVSNDPQAIANDYFVWFDHPVFGRTKMVGYPWLFSNTPASIRREAPGLGQHTEEILAELGYNRADIARFKDEQIIQVEGEGE